MAFDFATLNRAGGSLYKPHILGYSRTTDSGLGDRSMERATGMSTGELQAQPRLERLAQQDIINEQLQQEREAFELAKRQKEKEEYAKWEREQILNQVASELYADRKAVGDFAGGNSSEGLSPLSAAEQYLAAAKEAARRGKGAYAQDFLAQGQQLAAKEQQAKLDAEETRLKNDKLKEEAAALRKKNEANARDASNIIDSTDSMGNVRLIDKTTGEVFKTIEGAGKPSAGFEKSKENTEKAALKEAGALSQADRIIGKVEQASEKISGITAGAGFALTPESLETVTGARDLASDLNTIKANLGFAELQAMRDASPTGGALGQIAVQELLALQSTVASLDQAQSPDQLKARLGEIKAHYQNWKTTMEGKIPKGAGAASISSSPPPGAVRRKN